jgi:hypothetical protein
MKWSRKTFLLAVFALILVPVSLVSCTKQREDEIADRFIDKLTGAKTTEKSDADKPFSLSIIVSLGAFDAKTKKAIYPCEINFAADQQIGYREPTSANFTTVYGDRFTTNKQTDSEGWVRTTFLFNRMYKGDYIEISYKACDGSKDSMSILDYNIKSAKQISKDAFEITINKQIFITARPPAK